MLDIKKIKNIIEKTPSSPGVYKMMDVNNKVIYIGKAKNLKKRISQYFQKNYSHSTRTQKLLENIENIESISVNSDLEAIILETNIIKELKPKYNVIMKDDKNFIYIKITKEDFPRIQQVRKIENDNARYYGPKTASNKVTDTLKLLKKLFPYRHCNLNIKQTKENKVDISNKVIAYPCLDYFIKRCIGPCTGQCSRIEYNEIIENIINFFEGKGDSIIKNIKEKIVILAKNKEFEKAAVLRDKLLKIENILEKQNISDPNRKDTDIINYWIENERAYFNLFQVRDTKLISSENFILSAPETTIGQQDPEILNIFIDQYYKVASDIPKEILIPHSLDDQSIDELFFNNKIPKFTIPQIGDKNKLLELSLKNAKIFADRNKPSWQEESENNIKAMIKLQNLLKIDKELKRIECYDISHLSGTETVGSMVVFVNGTPKNEHYRKFKLKTVVDKPDDYKSMEEVLYRRFIRFSNFDLNYKIAKSKKNDKNIFLIKKNKNIICEIEIKSLNTASGIIEIKDNKEADKKLLIQFIKRIINKLKFKRFYINGSILNDNEYLLLNGFEKIKVLPPEISDIKLDEIFVYDKYKHKDDESFNKKPDLIVIDGGKGQLNVCVKILKDFNLDIRCISLAKRLEEIFTEISENPILLERNDEILKLLQRIRDEAHRFAITFNKDLRSKKFRKK